MLNSVIRFALRQPLLIIVLSILLMVIGLRQSTQLPIDVFPDLNRPRVVIITEAPGLAPEEVERLINVPLESVLNGANGVEDVRSSAGVGISVIFIEFDWGTDIYIDRQIVGERLAVVADRMPPGVQPQLAPITSIMGQIMLVGMSVSDDLPEEEGGGNQDSSKTSMLQLRQHADWIVRRRLMNIKGIAQVFSMGGEGGGQRQIQVLVDPDKLRRLEVTLSQVEEALGESNDNATGGYVNSGPKRLLVRILGRVEDISDLELLVVDGQRRPPVLLHQVARVVNGPEIPFGRAAVNCQPAVMLVIVKQPSGDTRKLTEEVLNALEELGPALPEDVRFEPEVYRMDRFIDRAIDNVMEALRDGGILVLVILFLFLMNFRTTFITLTAIPLSILVTVLVFTGFDMSINTMTLGGLAVSIGELVDDAIVDVENIHRRLRENRLASVPKSAISVVYKASIEVRSSIVYGTMIVVLVFIPLFALEGMPGRLFTPLSIAYIVSILASLLVSLTVTPVLSYFLLSRKGVWPYLVAVFAPALALLLSFMLLAESPLWLRLVVAAVTTPVFYAAVALVEWMSRGERESFILRGLKWLAEGIIRFSLRWSWTVIIGTVVMAGLSVVVVANLGRNFLPPFNEGSVQVSISLPPGTSLDETDRVCQQVDRALLGLDFVQQAGRRTGRAEEDEHVAGVNFSEIVLQLDPDSSVPREEQLNQIRKALDTVPGVESDSGRATTEQPISHLMSHMLSGVKAQIAIKIFGDDLEDLENIANEVRAAIAGTEGVVDLAVEQQTLIPQLQIRLDRQKLAKLGLTPGQVSHVVETAMNGRIVSQVLEGEATYDLVVRLDGPYRESRDVIKNLALELPSGGTVPLTAVADVPDENYEQAGPNQISRENGHRRIVVQCNVSGRSLSEVRDEIQQRLAPIEAQLPRYGRGYYIQYGGQFESEQAATRLLLMLSMAAILGVFLVLYSLFRSVNLALQVMAALPMAAIGAVAALVLTGQNLSVPSMVGFISLTGIASRNGILLIAHYLHLVRYEGETVTHEMIVRAGKERLAPVLMTALTSGIGLLPLALAAGQPGKEILYPVATVIIGGLMSSTLLDFFVHPALFWKFGRKAAMRLVAETGKDEAEFDQIDLDQSWS